MAASDYTTLKLGPVALTGFEIPRMITLGGEQRVVVNEFVGKKKRAVHLLGAQPRPIDWQGVFLYESARLRARFIESLMVLGDPLSLLWGDWSFVVVIRRFFYDPSQINHIPYEISLEVVQDRTDPQATLVPSRDTIPDGVKNSLGVLDSILTPLREILDVARNIQADIRREINNIVGLGNSLIRELTDVINVLFIQPTNIIQGFITDALTIADTADTLIDQLTISGPINAIEANLFGTTGERIDTNRGTAATGRDPMLSLIAARDAMRQLADLLRRLQQPPFVLNLTVVDDNLFSIASRFYGDINKWDAIADFNNLQGARVVGPKTIKLPPIAGVIPKQTGVPGTVYETATYAIPPAEASVTSSGHTRRPFKRRASLSTPQRG